MTHPLTAADFFSLEAGECLDRLESLLNREERPAGEDLLRAARALRGSALMAGQQPLARAAAGLETVTRALRDGSRDYDPAVREQVASAIEEFRLLLRRIREWGEGDTARAARLGAALESLAGAGPAEAAGRRAGGTELDAGVRAFIARENALIASALDRAARSLQIAPGDREPLYTVIRRMQSLRGLAELGELVPLPEILDGIELAVGDLTRLFAPPPGVEEVMSSAAAALTRIARDITEQGRPDPEAEEAHRFTDLLLRAFAVERDVVPIESLYFAGDTQALTPPLSQPQFASPAPLGPLELVSHGEHLCQIADLIGRSRSAIERDLRLYHLLAALRTAGTPGSDPVAGSLAVFARSTREALAAGVAARAPAAVVECLRGAGELLRSVADADDRMQVSRRVLDVAHRLDELRAIPADPDAELAIVPIQSLAYDLEPDVVPIESLAPDAAEAGGESGLESSFTTFKRLERERGPAAASLDALLRRPRPLPAGRPPVEEVVSIEALCYRGRGALERALAVRHELAAELAGPNDPASIHPLLQELLDLVPLALADS
ncbi:MAG: Hpt domain-containing protein [Gemmatimonadales bacterium]|nr:Hpt domain-containing protein [Gemmatimonadales bacterium]